MLYEMVHWDSETHTILPGRPAPPPVCVQYLGVKDGVATTPQIITGDAMLDWFAWAISSGSILCGLNQSYDLLVMIEYAIRRGVPKLDVWRKVFEHLAAGLSRCTEIRERLLRIARGMPDVAGLSMEDQAKTYLGLDLKSGKAGPESFRLRYGELECWPTEAMLNDPNAPLADILTLEQALALRAGTLVYGAPRPPATWPRKAIDYALQDPVIERRIYLAQQGVATEVFGQTEIPDERARPVAKFCLHLMASRGLRVDGERAIRAGESLERQLVKLRALLVKADLMREKIVFKGKPNERHDGYTKNMKLIHERVRGTLEAAGKPVAYNAPTLNKKTGGLNAPKVKADKEVMQLAELHDDADLRTLTAFSGIEKKLATYVKPLMVDCGAPASGWCGLTRPVHWRYDAVKDTGRTSAKMTRYTVRSVQTGEETTLRDGNNVQNYPTIDAMLTTARDVLERLGPGTPGDGLYDLPGDACLPLGHEWRLDETAMTPKQFLEYRERRWARFHDIRPMVIAREGFLLVNRDYSGIEMATLAQAQCIHFGREVTLAAVLNHANTEETVPADLLPELRREVVGTIGLDPHLYAGVILHPLLYPEDPELNYWQLLELRFTYEQKKKRGQAPNELEKHAHETRKLCKVMNFGLLGGMGAETFVQYVWQRVRVRLTIDLAKKAKRAWFTAFPEMPEWFAYIGQQQALDLPVVQIGSGRVRGGCSFTQNANTRFQGLAADGALNALFLIWQACLTDPTSPLYGCFPLVFEHDAFLVEVVADRAAAADAELDRLMVLGMRQMVPDVHVKTEGSKPSFRWDK